MQNITQSLWHESLWHEYLWHDPPALSMGTAHVLQALAAINFDHSPTPDRNFQTILPLALLFPPSTFPPTSLPNKTLCIL